MQMDPKGGLGEVWGGNDIFPIFFLYFLQTVTHAVTEMIELYI